MFYWKKEEKKPTYQKSENTLTLKPEIMGIRKWSNIILGICNCIPRNIPVEDGWCLSQEMVQPEGPLQVLKIEGLCQLSAAAIVPGTQLRGHRTNLSSCTRVSDFSAEEWRWSSERQNTIYSPFILPAYYQCEEKSDLLEHKSRRQQSIERS